MYRLSLMSLNIQSISSKFNSPLAPLSILDEKDFNFNATCLQKTWLTDSHDLSPHYSEVIMSAMVSQITGDSIVCSSVCRGTAQRKISKLRVTGFCDGNPPVIGGFPKQRASNAENDFIWWRHHDVPFLASNRTTALNHVAHKVDLSYIWENSFFIFNVFFYSMCFWSMGWYVYWYTRGEPGRKTYYWKHISYIVLPRITTPMHVYRKIYPWTKPHLIRHFLRLRLTAGMRHSGGTLPELRDTMTRVWRQGMYAGCTVEIL